MQVAEFLSELVRDDFESFASNGETLSEDAGYEVNEVEFQAAAAELVRPGLVRSYRWEAACGAYAEHESATLAAEEIWLLAV